MARKTNKTAHVLNLLAAGTADENEQKEAAGPSLAPNISIEDNPTSSADPLAGLIRNTLNKEILQDDEYGTEEARADVSDDTPEEEAEESAEEYAEEEPEQEAAPKTKASSKAAPKAAKKAKTEEAAESEEEPAPDEPTPPAKKKKTTAKSKAGKADEAIEQMTAVSEDAVIPEPEPDAEVPAVNEPEAEAAPPEAETAPPEAPAPEPEAVPAPEPEAVAAPAAKEYVYLNMMEILVEERLMEFLNKFGACTCHRCVLDARALALSNLPPKYLVIPDSSTAPLTSFYRNKFSIYIVTELTKACLAIINSPRH